MRVVVVFARCGENGIKRVQELTAAGIPYHVYQKRPCNNSHNAYTLAEFDKVPGQVRWMEHNAGDECSAYLQYMYDEYENLPHAVYFLQYAAEVQLMLPSVTSVVNASIRAVMKEGYIALSKHSFEGRWPAPCEPKARQPKFRSCSPTIWHDLNIEPPNFFRFYANGLFAVRRDRILMRPRSFYADLLRRFTGAEKARCDGPDIRGHRLQGRMVGDCHVLEKAWHVLFGANAILPPASVYDQLRAPGMTLRIGGQFYETVQTRETGKCRGDRAGAAAARAEVDAAVAKGGSTANCSEGGSTANCSEAGAEATPTLGGAPKRSEAGAEEPPTLGGAVAEPALPLSEAERGRLLEKYPLYPYPKKGV